MLLWLMNLGFAGGPPADDDTIGGGVTKMSYIADDPVGVESGMPWFDYFEPLMPGYTQSRHVSVESDLYERYDSFVHAFSSITVQSAVIAQAFGVESDINDNNVSKESIV